jgi:hypothetical protein
MKKYLKFEDLHDFWSFSFRDSNSNNKSSRASKSDWYGNVSWEEAKILASNGWIEGLQEIKKISVELSEIIANKIVRYEPEYGVGGGVVDVGAFLSNSPEYFMMKNPTEKEQVGKIITIVCSVSFSAAIDSKVIIQRGAMVCALADAIEMSGFRCEIIANETSTSKSGKLEIDVTLKNAQQSLNIIELAFCLAHPAMLRRFMFSVAELEGWADYAYCYGTPYEATEKGNLYVDKIYSHEVPNYKAIGWVTEQLEKLGIKIKNN